MTTARSDVRALLDSRSDAIRARDIDRLMAIYATDVVYFDLVPPLQYAGTDALRERFREWFEAWESPIGNELRDVRIVASDDAAAANMLIRASGTRRGGREVDYWVRASNGFRRSDDGWLIVHEHISLPVDMQTGRAVIDLAP